MPLERVCELIQNSNHDIMFFSLHINFLILCSSSPIPQKRLLIPEEFFVYSPMKKTPVSKSVFILGAFQKMLMDLPNHLFFQIPTDTMEKGIFGNVFLNIISYACHTH